MDRVDLLRKIKYILPYGYIEHRHRHKIFTDHSENKYVNEPRLYNCDGDALRIFFLRDGQIGEDNYSFTRKRQPIHIYWDRNNALLPTHFYGHYDIFNCIGKPKKKFALLIETEDIEPYLYERVLKNTDILLDYDCIFTHSERVLNKYKNARFIPAGGVWYGLVEHGGQLDIGQYRNKSRMISIVSSKKEMCELHRLRKRIAFRCKDISCVDSYGDFDGGNKIKIGDSLQDYRFSIVIENTISKYCFTEKILNCFAAETIPIYIGAEAIGDFFDSNGIIQIKPKEVEEHLEDILQMCNENYYNSKISSILGNYNRVQNFLCQEDYIFTQYRELIM